jgi:hypothetical protein
LDSRTPKKKVEKNLKLILDPVFQTIWRLDHAFQNKHCVWIMGSKTHPKKNGEIKYLDPG